MKELCLRLIMTKTNQEFIIKALQDLHQRTVSQYDWHLEANKKVIQTETDNWYLRWKVGYLEQKIKENLPDLALYHKDDEEFNRIKKDVNSHKELNDKE